MKKSILSDKIKKVTGSTMSISERLKAKIKSDITTTVKCCCDC